MAAVAESNREKKMCTKIALIVSDEAPRRNYLFQRFESAGMQPVSYLNQGAYLLDLEEREPGVMVIDLSMPVERKLQLVDRARQRYPSLKVILIGKREYLESKGRLDRIDNVVVCDRLEQLQY